MKGIKSKPDILNCICGNTPHIETENETYNGKMFKLACDCGMTGPMIETEHQAIMIWNLGITSKIEWDKIVSSYPESFITKINTE